MTAPKKKVASKRASSTVIATAAEPDLWSAKGVSINLSQPRREALKAFADASGHAMTPAQGLYALIDRIAIEPPNSNGSLEITQSPNRSAGLGQVINDQLIQRLTDIEEDGRDTRIALTTCAAALEDLARAMTPLHDLIALMSSVSTSPMPDISKGQGQEEKALGLRDWLSRAIQLTGASPKQDIVFALGLARRPQTHSNQVQMAFHARIVRIDKQPTDASTTTTVFPLLELSVEAGSALAVCISVEPRADLAIAFARMTTGAWQATARLKTGPGSYGRVLFEAQA